VILRSAITDVENISASFDNGNVNTANGKKLSPAQEKIIQILNSASKWSSSSLDEKNGMYNNSTHKRQRLSPAASAAERLFSSPRVTQVRFSLLVVFWCFSFFS
jgi:hypothetical protein